MHNNLNSSTTQFAVRFAAPLAARFAARYAARFAARLSQPLVELAFWWMATLGINIRCTQVLQRLRQSKRDGALRCDWFGWLGPHWPWWVCFTMFCEWFRNHANWQLILQSTSTNINRKTWFEKETMSSDNMLIIETIAIMKHFHSNAADSLNFSIYVLEQINTVESSLRNQRTKCIFIDNGKGGERQD